MPSENITELYLQKLRNEMPRGAQRRIADLLDIPQSRVSEVLNGALEREYADDVIRLAETERDKALERVRQREEDFKAKMARLNKTPAS